MKRILSIILAVAVLIALGFVIASQRQDAKEGSAVSAKDRETAAAAESSEAGAAQEKENAAPGGSDQAPQDQKNDDPTKEEHPSEAVGGNSPEGTIVTITADTAWTAWDAFLALSPEEQDAFMKSFENPEAFTEWMLAAQAEWAAAHPMEEIGPGDVIDFGG